ncbi:MAG: hypothetical protein R3C14_14880 [Caldilineaceae bacterium]
MVVAIVPSLQQSKQQPIGLSENGLQLDLHVSLNLGITAKQAKRKLSRFLLDEVSLFIGPEEPLLVFIEPTKIVWRFPLQFALAKQGRLGQVGTVDVDAQSGELLLIDEHLMEIKRNARLLARSATLPTDA